MGLNKNNLLRRNEVRKIKINKLYQIDNLELLKQLPNESIDLIYSDILYNTGKKFKDFDDRLGTPQQAIQWYEPRLKEMHRVLKKTGSIYLHMDYRLVHYMKIKMDEIFGLNNFRNDIIWCYGAGGSKKNIFATKHDNILFYTKTITYTWNQIYDDKTKAKIKDYWQIKSIADKSGCLRHGDTEFTIYNTQKPLKLMERIIKASSNENDVVADFFMGSGSFIVKAKELGRNYIGCDINPNAVEITQQRLKINYT